MTIKISNIGMKIKRGEGDINGLLPSGYNFDYLTIIYIYIYIYFFFPIVRRVRFEISQK
jgi:hypothetical protein